MEMSLDFKNQMKLHIVLALTAAVSAMTVQESIKAIQMANKNTPVTVPAQTPSAPAPVLVKVPLPDSNGAKKADVPPANKLEKPSKKDECVNKHSRHSKKGKGGNRK